jgi:hypothetical protein
MSEHLEPTPPPPDGLAPGARRLDLLVPLGLVAAWIAVQAWALPSAGVKT